MSQSTPPSTDDITAQIEELDDLVYRRFRAQHQSHRRLPFSQEDEARLRQIVSLLWDIPKPQKGSIVAGCRLLEIIGKGAFGTVWRAETISGGAPRAVKIFDSDRLGDGVAVHLFRRGVKAMIYLRQALERQASDAPQHAIVQIREVEPHYLAFAMDLLPGPDLAAGYLPGKSLAQKLTLFICIAEAVRFGHEQEGCIVHRDIKPHNIVMDGDTPVLTDFDIADMAFAKTLSQRAVGGALAYAAPEQLSGDCDQLEVRSDIYSLGRLLHFFLLEEDPPLQYGHQPILSALDSFPEGLVKIIHKCTHPQPPLRYSSVDELLFDLQHYEEAATVGDYHPSPKRAEVYLRKAQQQAQQGDYNSAENSAEQALAYLQDSDPYLTKQWRQKLQWWRIRQGQWTLFPGFLLRFMQRQLTPFSVTALALLLALLSYILFFRSGVDASLERHVQALMKDSSNDQHVTKNAISSFRANPQRQQKANQRMALLLSQHKGRTACRLFHALHELNQQKDGVYRASLKEEKGLLFVSPSLLPSLLDRHLRTTPFMFRRSVSVFKKIHCRRKLSWRGVSFQNIEFAQFRSVEADFRFAGFHNVNFAKSDFRRSDFRFIKAISAHFVRNRLEDSNFQFARLDWTDFQKAQLRGANFRFAELHRCTFDTSPLYGVDFRFATFYHFPKLPLRSFRQSKTLNTMRWNIEGAFFSHTAIDFWRRNPSFVNALCLEQDLLLRNHVDACYEWHTYPASHDFWSQRPKPPSPPRLCPRRLRGPVFVYPPGSLKREGQCPWQQEAQLPSSQPASLLLTKPSSRPSEKAQPASLKSRTHPTSSGFSKPRAQRRRRNTILK